MKATIVLQDDGYYIDIDDTAGNVVPYGDIATVVVADQTYLTLCDSQEAGDQARSLGSAKVYRMAGATLSSGLLQLDATFEYASDDDEEEEEEGEEEGEEDGEEEDDEEYEDGDEVEEVG